MAQVAEHEDRSIRQYVEGQLHDDEDGVTLVQRVGQERVGGTTYSMYDVHTIKGRWWVITEPTNLYDQEAFPEVDYVLSFHIGLKMRIVDRGRVEVEEDLREHAEGAWRRYAAAVEA
ncbi:MAG TPA: gamma-glutamylcyclotransferase, partial [Coriobacteriia bacterium]|nr:gamma-glutamylcyclotransferase [Coriobacteriia bacterium]